MWLEHADEPESDERHHHERGAYAAPHVGGRYGGVFCGQQELERSGRRVHDAVCSLLGAGTMGQVRGFIELDLAGAPGLELDASAIAVLEASA